MKILFWVAIAVAVLTFMFAAPFSVAIVVTALAVAGIAHIKHTRIHTL